MGNLTLVTYYRLINARIMKASRKIDISKSSLISLKAELSRKQDEVSKAKAQSQAQFIRPLPQLKKKTLWTKTNAGISERAEKDLEEEKEEQDIFKKSRAALEEKSKLYDKLSQDSSVLADDTRFLVDFQQKTADERIESGETSSTKASDDECEKEEEEEHFSDDYDVSLDPEEDWVNYVDCLGRTRRCLRKDLAHVKERDVKLFESLGGFDDKNEASGNGNRQTALASGEGVSGDGTDPELMSGDMRRELLRQKWEQQEEQLRNKADIHYQDVLFDEARSHGVGYYGFSQDEVRRRAQQDALSKLRQETQREQVAAKGLRERRQQQLQARMKAARQRKRARLGLPLEENDMEQPVADEELEEREKEAAEPEPEPKPVKKKQPHVRPWDVGKEGVKEIMSQEDWVKKKRTDRPQEFAPPSSYPQDSILNPAVALPEKPRPTLFFSSKKPPVDKGPKRPWSERSHGRDEVCGEGAEVPPPSTFWDDRPTLSTDTKSKSQSRNIEEDEDKRDVRGKGTEIPPPATFEYYGPSFSRSGQRLSKPKVKDLENSITAGLKYLRQQAEERQSQREKGLLDIL